MAAIWSVDQPLAGESAEAAKVRLAAEEAAFCARMETERKAVAERDRKAKADAEALGREEAAAAKARKDAADAARLELVMTMQMPTTYLMGTVADRRAWMARTGISREALERAASAGSMSAVLNTEDPFHLVPPPHDRQLAAVCALGVIARRQMSLEEQAAEAEREAARREALRIEGDRLVAEAGARRALEQKMEG